MKPDESNQALLRKTLTDAVEEKLRGALDDGRWKDRLPGMRALAVELGVGVSTVSAAAARLRQAGLLEAAGPKSRLRISRELSARDNMPAPGRLLFLTHTPLPATSPAVGMVFRELARRQSSWTIRHRTHPFQDQVRVPRGWDRILDEEAPGFMVLVSGTPLLASWAASRRISTILFGGDPGDSGLPLIGVEIAGMLAQALDHLLALGHRHIVFPLCGRNAAGCERLRRMFSARLHRAGLPFAEGYHTPMEFERSRSTLVAALERVWRAHPPTALVLFDWNEFVATSCFLGRRGLSIPEDISVVVLEDHASHNWHDPVITHFDYPVEAAARALNRWSKSPQRFGSRKMILESRWFAGDSTAPPPA